MEYFIRGSWRTFHPRQGEKNEKVQHRWAARPPVRPGQVPSTGFSLRGERPRPEDQIPLTKFKLEDQNDRQQRCESPRAESSSGREPKDQSQDENESEEKDVQATVKRRREDPTAPGSDRDSSLLSPIGRVKRRKADGNWQSSIVDKLRSVAEDVDGPVRTKLERIS